MTDSFDPTDLKYQADKEFAPDKDKEWQYPPQNDGWFHAHNAIRGELLMIQECCESLQKQASQQDPSSITLKDWQAQALQTIFDAHFHFIHSHHSNEDDIATPALSKRIVYPDKLTSDHDGLVKALADLKTSIEALKPGDDVDETMTALLKQWSAYRMDLEEHLSEEEEIGLTLARAYFTPKEYGVITHQIIAKETKLEMGSFVYHMGENRMRTEFMKQHSIPFFVWHLNFRGALKLYRQGVVEFVEALKSGVEPIPQRGGLLGC